MGFGLRRADLQRNAERKLDDAEILFRNGGYSNSYYLAGFAVEIGLKACVARHQLPETIPSEEVLKNFLVHDYNKLVGLAGLMRALREHQDASNEFAANWGLVSQWHPSCRYGETDVYTAQVMLDAVGNPVDGVLSWIKTHW
jgi:hypothetical protein